MNPEVQSKLESGEVEQAKFIESMLEQCSGNISRYVKYLSWRTETCSRKDKIIMDKYFKMKKIIKGYSTEVRHLTWTTLENEAKVNVCISTIEKVISTLNYRYCLSCNKRCVNNSTGGHCIDFSEFIRS